MPAFMILMWCQREALRAVAAEERASAVIRPPAVAVTIQTAATVGAVPIARFGHSTTASTAPSGDAGQGRA